MSQSTEVKLSRRYRLDKMKNQIANEIEQITKQGLHTMRKLVWKSNTMD
jgi:hypothetical protein